VWADRFQRDETQPINEEKAIGARINDWLRSKEILVEAKKLSPRQYDLLVRSLKRLESFVGSSLPIDQVKGDCWQGFYDDLMKRVNADEFKVRSAQIFFTNCRSFLRNQIEWGALPPLLNLNSKDFQFEIDHPDPETFEIEELHQLLRKARGQLRLHIYLALNCGMTQVDIGNLHPREVDLDKKLQSGTIKRKRSKTRSYDNVPMVTHPLWKETVEELKKYQKTRDADHFLLNRDGKPWWYETGTAKTSKKDGVSTNFKRLMNELKFTKRSFKSLRKTAATALEDHLAYRGLIGLFLDHAPRTTAEKHYAKTGTKPLAEAVMWLRQELKIDKV
jgi:integrase